MEAIRIKKRLEEEPAGLPELRPFVGRDVEIIVLAEGAEVEVPRTPSEAEWGRIQEDLEVIRDGYDFKAWKELRRRSRL